MSPLPAIMQRAFLDRSGRVPVASTEYTVAYPELLKQALVRLEKIGLRDQAEPSPSGTRETVGLLFHGPARVGKSSLVAQVLSKLDGANTAVLTGPFDGLALLDAVVGALAVPEAVKRAEVYRYSPPQLDEIEEVLIDLFDRFTHAESPLIIVVDHFDTMLRENDSAPRRLQNQCLEPIALLLRSCRRTSGYASLIFTSRSMFTVPDRGLDLSDSLAPIELSLPDPKIARRLTEDALSAASSPTPETSSAQESSSRLGLRILRSSLGHLGLIDLLTRLAGALPETLEPALTTLESYLDGRGEVPREEIHEVVAFFESLIFERLLQGLSLPERDLLRLSTSFETLAPLGIVEEFARRFSLLDESLSEAGGLEHSRLAALGLWDFLDREGLQVIPNPVARERAGQLDDEERPAVAMHLIQLFIDAWLPSEQAVANPEQSLQLLRLAIHAGAPEIINRVLPTAMTTLQRAQLDERAHHLGSQALHLMDTSRHVPSAASMISLAELCYRLGKTAEGAALLERAASEERSSDSIQASCFDRILAAAKAAEGDFDHAIELVEQAKSGFESADRPWDVAATLSLLADVRMAAAEADKYTATEDESDGGKLATKGLEAALTTRHQELEIVSRLSETRRQISILGHIGHLQVALGRDEDALVSHESALEASRTLDNPHLINSIQGEIAGVLLQNGHFDRALALHREQMEHFKQAGDPIGLAHALWSSARVELKRQRIDAAMNLLIEAYHINLELDRPEGIGLVGLDYGQVLWAAGMMGEARLILERSVESFRRVGDEVLHAQARSILEELTTVS